MRKLYLKLGIFLLCVPAAHNSSAQQDPLTFGISLQQVWDSNYARTPEEDAERIALASAFVTLDKTFSSQRIIANWNGRRYEHDERTDLDATLHNAQLALKSHWTNRLRTEVEWTRDSYSVDYLEFSEKDIIKHDEAKAQIGYGAGHKLSVSGGARQIKQTHTNEERQGLNFEDEEGFFELAYQTGIKSKLAARVRAGERVYPNDYLVISADDLVRVLGDLDFDYEQVEVEGTWIVSPKTNVSATLAYFTRDGVINDGEGLFASTEGRWEMTPKVQLSGGYSFRQPAIGETSDSPSDVHLVYVDASWQWTDKISLGTGARVIEYRYEGLSLGPERNESLYNATPLKVTYDATESLSLRLTTGWTDRQSSLDYRNYTSAEASVGAYIRY